MKVTLANVTEYVKALGYEPVQIDGIPEGFSFKAPNLTIGDKEHIGGYVAFIPLRSWEEISRINAPTQERLLEIYNKETK